MKRTMGVRLSIIFPGTDPGGGRIHGGRGRWRKPSRKGRIPRIVSLPGTGELGFLEFSNAIERLDSHGAPEIIAVLLFVSSCRSQRSFTATGPFVPDPTLESVMQNASKAADPFEDGNGSLIVLPLMVSIWSVTEIRSPRCWKTMIAYRKKAWASSY